MAEYYNPIEEFYGMNVNMHPHYEFDVRPYYESITVTEFYELNETTHRTFNIAKFFGFNKKDDSTDKEEPMYYFR